MAKSMGWLQMGLCAAALFCAGRMWAADNELTEPEKAAGWKLLFNGKDTEGWTSRLEKTVVGWKAENGELTRFSKGVDILYSAEQFENFELSIDFKSGGNSGVFVRLSDQKNWINTGMEIQVLPTQIADANEKIPGKHDVGSLYDLVPANPAAPFKPKDWNHFDIKCNGPLVSCRMNGVETFMIDLREEKWKTPQGKFKLPYATLPRKGWVMMQDHGAKVSYKNIKVRVLKDDEVVK